MAQQDQNQRKEGSTRGFASMNPEQQRAIARKGGEAVSGNREHMAQIGRKGGQVVSENREHMAEIGRKGGESSGNSRSNRTNQTYRNPQNSSEAGR
jgi:general stress protein YciG